MLTAMVGIQLYQTSGWWKENRGTFHFEENLTYGRQVDKIGHFYGASVLTFVLSRSLEWARVPKPDALWYGAGASALFQTYIEVQDGFSRAWGFDRVDFAANILGAAHPVARHYWPWLRTVDLKLSYLPTENLNRPGAAPGIKHLMMDDYEGQTYWLSLRVDDVLPESAARLWPDFLCIAVGYGARNILTGTPYSVYYIGLDLDMTRIIPDDTPFLKALGEALNYVRLPLPAVQVYPSGIAYGIFF